ncbi:MAG: sigma-70 family RNA polymerase sigma factor [Candidatus Dojkabacteria bacterium]|nr:sigma-70 family RNA polymerase sigma factor [Candidatus Dojkabacteria bacterium]
MIELIEKIEETDELSKEFQAIVDRFNEESNKEIPYVPVTNDPNPVPQLMADLGRYTLLNDKEVEVLSIIKDKANESSIECINGNGNLNSEKKAELVKDIQDGIIAKEILGVLNMPLVISIAYKYTGKIPFQDLIDSGYIGLRIGIERYNHKLGYKLSTYASHWIKQSIRRTIENERTTIRIGREKYRKIMKYDIRESTLRRELGRKPTEEELCIDLQITPQVLRSIREAKISYISLDMEVDEGRKTVEETLANKDDSVETKVYINMDSEYIKKHISELKSDEQRIINMRFGFEDGETKTLKQIGNILGTTREAVRQREKNILRKLKNNMSERYKDNI